MLDIIWCLVVGLALIWCMCVLAGYRGVVSMCEYVIAYVSVFVGVVVMLWSVD